MRVIKQLEIGNPDERSIELRAELSGYHTHADLNAATNIQRRLGHRELHACKGRKQVKSLLRERQQEWKKQNGWP